MNCVFIKKRTYIFSTPTIYKLIPKKRERRIGACLFPLPELGVGIGTCPEIDRRNQVVETVQLERGAPVILEQLDLRKANRFHRCNRL